MFVFMIIRNFSRRSRACVSMELSIDDFPFFFLCLATVLEVSTQVNVFCLVQVDLNSLSWMIVTRMRQEEEDEEEEEGMAAADDDEKEEKEEQEEWWLLLKRNVCVRFSEGSEGYWEGLSSVWWWMNHHEGGGVVVVVVVVVKQWLWYIGGGSESSIEASHRFNFQ